MVKRFIAPLLVMLLAACHDRRPPAPTPEQNQQLNEMEKELNAMANEEGPADRSTGPSNSSSQ
jgi:hypothetical protein